MIRLVGKSNVTNPDAAITKSVRESTENQIIKI